MTDIFSYSGRGVLPIYLPGIPAYGQKGAPGNTGINGSSIYFSSYNLELYNDEIINKIKAGEPLSNNQDYNKKNLLVKYIDNDIFIDVTGNFYVLKFINGEPVLDKLYTGIYSQSPIKFHYFNIGFKTSFVNEETISDDDKKFLWRQPNPLYIVADTGDRTNNKIHDEYYSPYVYGNYIQFKLNIDSENPCTYKFYIELPDGEVISINSKEPDPIIFIDNKYCYSCNDFYNYRVPVDKTRMNIFRRLEDNNSGFTKTVKQIFDEYSEASPEFSAMTEHYISNKCKMYAEVTDQLMSNIYRFDFGEAYISEDIAVIDKSEVSAAKGRQTAANQNQIKSKQLQIVIPTIKLSPALIGKQILTEDTNGNNTDRRVSRRNTSGTKRKTGKSRK